MYDVVPHKPRGVRQNPYLLTADVKFYEHYTLPVGNVDSRQYAPILL